MGGDLGSGSGGGSVLGGGALCTGAVARNNSRGKQKKHSNDRNIAKGTTDPRVEFILKDHSSQFTNLEHIMYNFRISIKH